MLEAIARSLRELYTVDAVTNKGDCLDLLRANPFEVIVAGERLEDGSGLELLGQIAKRWPSVLRIFAADPERLKLLRGKLGPFELFQTLTYPIDPDRLLSVLTLADAAQDANADTSNIQHVVLGSDIEFDEPDPFPPPRPEPRVVPQTGAAAALSEPEPDDEPAPVPRIRKIGTAGPVIRPRVGNTPVSRIGRAVPAAPESRSTPTNGAAPPAPASRTASPAPGGRTPSPGPAGRSTPPAPETRPRSGSQRPAPVRFPALETPDPAPERAARKPGTGGQPALWEAPITNALADAALMADEARFGIDSLQESAFRRTLVRAGVGGALVLGVVLLGYKLFGGKSQPTAAPAQPPAQQAQAAAPSPATPVAAQAQAAALPVAATAAATSAAALAQRGAAGSKGARHEATSASQNPEATRSASAQSSSVSSEPHAGSTASESLKTARMDEEALPPETPVGATRAGTESAAAVASAETSGSSTAPATPAAPSPTSASPPASADASPAPAGAMPAAGVPAAGVPASGTSAAPIPAAPKPASADELPPVIREAKLIRRVAPDYPSAAKRDGIEGSVDLEITVSAQGAVTNAAIVHSEPADVFDKSALAAVRRWKYDPQYVDGLPAEAHLKIHLDFKAGQDNR